MDKKDMAQDKKMAKKAVGMHEKQLHGGKKSNLAALKKGGMAKKMAAGGNTSMNLDKLPSLNVNTGSNTPAKTKAKAKRTTPGAGMSNVGGVKMGPSFANTPGKVYASGMAKKMAGGGCAKMARGGGIEVRGKTKGKMC